MRVAHDPPFGSTEGNVYYGTFPGHPHGQGTDRIFRFLGMLSDATFARPPSVVVLYPKALENASFSVIHPYWNAEVVLPQRNSQQLPGGTLQIEKIGDFVKLLLGHVKRIEAAGTHIYTSQ
jgi:hypothetical protein